MVKQCLKIFLRLCFNLRGLPRKSKDTVCQERLKQTYLLSSLTLLISLLALRSYDLLYLRPLSTCYLFSLSLSRMCSAVLFFPAICCLFLSGLAPAKLMNGYMVLANGGSQPRSSPSLSSRTLSRPAGDVIVNMDSEPGVRKMDTVVKLDAVSLIVVC